MDTINTAVEGAPGLEGLRPGLNDMAHLWQAPSWEEIEATEKEQAIQ